MQIIKYDDILSKRNIAVIKKSIADDGVIIYPTDTLYGLGGNFFSLPVIEKIDALKNRRDIPYSVMVSGLEMIHDLVDGVPAVFHELHRKLLPGKFTFLFRVSPSVNPALVKGSDKIGIRIPHVPGMLKLLGLLNIPLVSTSVNRSGQPPLNDPAAILLEFSNAEARPAPGLLIDAGVLPPSRGSTILDLTQSPIKCTRVGDDCEKLKQLDFPITYQRV
jgi:L-threonylcarbamoyladenylate synthase